MLINHAELIIDINSIPSDVMSDSTKTLVRSYIITQEPVPAIPVQFISDRIKQLSDLQKKMSQWTTPELEIQIQTLVNLISDYTNSTEERKEE